MADLATAKAVNAHRAQRPMVAVFVGGTSGIGEYTVRALAENYADGEAELRVHVVGRNGDAADKIFAHCREVCPGGTFIFTQVADLTLIKDVDSCCKQLVQLEREAKGDAARIDLLVLSQGVVNFGGRRQDTAEGLDASMTLMYYSRVRFIQQLSTLFSASSPAHVISVYAGGLEAQGKLITADLSLRQPGHYSFANCRTNVVHMKTVMFERLSREYAGRASLVHVFPGLVIGPTFYAASNPWWFKIAWTLLGPLVKLFFAVPAAACGQHTLFLASPRFPARDEKVDSRDVVGGAALATDGSSGGGAYSANYDGKTNDVEKFYVQLKKGDFPESVWSHTMKAFSVIEAGGVFAD